MTQEEFNVVFELQMRKCADILAHKNKEYTEISLTKRVLYDKLNISKNI